jgi:hypothetical protein
MLFDKDTVKIPYMSMTMRSGSEMRSSVCAMTVSPPLFFFTSDVMDPRNGSTCVSMLRAHCFEKRLKRASVLKSASLREFWLEFIMDYRKSTVNSAPSLFFFTSVVMCVRNVSA